LLRLHDGKLIETTLYEHLRDGQLVDISIDISTMVGCPIGCKFCSATTGKYIRSLSSRELIDQFTSCLHHVKASSCSKIIAGFQGIGEPSMLADEVFYASHAILEQDERNVISISTTGANIQGIRHWREKCLPIAVLQFSLTSATGNPSLMPNAGKIDELFDEIVLCSQSDHITSTTVNYILLEGINDSNACADILTQYFSDQSVDVRIASLNRTKSSDRYLLNQATADEAVRFADYLKSSGVSARVFGAFNDTNVSCGQLTFDEVAGDSENE
jgi:23S rRNA (adenine2503-C2)-methyltransferase